MSEAVCLISILALSGDRAAGRLSTGSSKEAQYSALKKAISVD